MSRTDKTRPSWVRAYDPTEPREAYHRHMTWRGEPLACDYYEPRPRSRAEHWARHCCCYPAWPRRMRTSGIPRWFVNVTWSAPERVRERDGLRDAAREYNAHGDLDDFDFDNPQHRHRSRWWWD